MWLKTLRGECGIALVLLYVCVLVGFMADMLLVPYYPQYFLQVYGVENPQYVGILIAACRFVMIFAYPAWAKLSKTVPTLKILIYTQAMAGAAVSACMWAPNEWLFLILSMVHVAFKSSYLLIYPLIVNWAGKENHTHAVSSYGLVTYFATLVAAVIGGSLLEFSDPRYILLIMAITDWLQMGVSWWLLKRQPAPQEEAQAAEAAQGETGRPIPVFGILWLVFLYYAALSLIRPYFTRFMEQQPFGLNSLEAGILFVLPAVVCIAAALSYKRLGLDRNLPWVITAAALLVVVTTWVQVAGETLTTVVAGRMAYGLALFLIQVGIDLLLFRSSKPGDMAWNYRLIAIGMNSALIIAPFSLGYIIEFGGLFTQFYVSMAVSALFLVSAVVIFYPVFGKKQSFLTNHSRKCDHE